MDATRNMEGRCNACNAILVKGVQACPDCTDPKIGNYGKELILDLHNCEPKLFTREFIAQFFERLCTQIDMERCELFWWDDLETPEEEKETEPHLVGTSAVQFIKTSNVTIHTLDIMKRVYLNIFSCKDFDSEVVAIFSKAFFRGEIVNQKTIERI